MRAFPLHSVLFFVIACGGAERPARDAAPAPPRPVDAGHDAGPVDPGPKRAMAKRFAGYVRGQPNATAPRLGYVRAGAVLRTRRGLPSGTEGCAGGWYELEAGGFVCNGYDVVVFDGRRLPFGRGRQPRMNEPLPYEYGTVRREAPMYRRLPTDDEAVIYEGYVIPGTEPVEGEGDAPPAEAGGTAPAESASAAPTAESAPTGAAPEPAATERAAQAPAAPAGEAAPAAADPVAEAPAEETPPPTLEDLQGERGSIVLRTLMPGFILTLDRTLRIGERRYWRTHSNGFVPAARVGRRASSTDFQGVELDGATWSLPVAFHVGRGASFYEKDPRGRMRTARGRRMGYHARVRVVGRETVEGDEYLAVEGERYLRPRDVVLIEARARPPEVQPNDFWIDVDLTNQSLVAYEGDRPVYATLVSSGREGPEGENFRTPTGTWRIEAKHLTTTMDGDSASDGPYSIDDVPYVMYFFRSYALHGAFWHDRFGHTKSHGCVNLAPLDARFIFRWSPPHVPDGWHGAFSTAESPGAWVVVRGEPRE